MAKLLLAEDEEMLAQAITYVMEQEGLTVTTVFNGAEAIAVLRRQEFDLVILDITMPYVDGLDVARFARQQQPRLPILMLTALSGESHLLTGFEAGADDYLTKPFSYKELIVRTRALLRRGQRQPRLHPPLAVTKEPLLMIGRLKLDPNIYMAWLDEVNLALTPTEFRILLYLAKNIGRACRAREILAAVQGYKLEEGEAREILRVHIQHIRQKMNLEPTDIEYVQNVYGVGYTLSG